MQAAAKITEIKSCKETLTRKFNTVTYRKKSHFVVMFARALNQIKIHAVKKYGEEIIQTFRSNNLVIISKKLTELSS